MLLGAVMCILLDIIGFIVVAKLSYLTTNIFLLLLAALMMFIFCYDATKALSFVFRVLKNK